MSEPSDKQTTGWRPIDTAPMDGTWVLLGWPTPKDHFGPSVVIAQHNEHGWFKAGWGYGIGHLATHWMPLPEAPRSDDSPWAKPIGEWGLEDVEQALDAELRTVS